MEIITASYFLPMTNGAPVTRDGAIAVELGRIKDAGVACELKERYPGAEVREFPGCALMPGLCSAHCHLDLAALYSPVFGSQEEQADGLHAANVPNDFVSMIIEQIDYKHDSRPERIIEGIQRGINRLIETGVTCVGDMTHFEGTFKLLRETGLRAVVYPEILAGRGEAAQHKFEVALALLEKYTDASHDRVRVGLGPYAPYLLSRNLLKIISRHAHNSSIPVMIHAAESFAEMEFFFDSQGPIASEVWPALGWTELPPAQRKTPVAYLAEIGFFEAPTTIVGGLQLSAKDLPLLARHLVRVVWCPSINRLMKHGQFPYAKLSEHGIPMGIGTEMWMGRLGFNMWEEMRIATTEGASPAPSTRDVLRMATSGGAMALGLDHLVGTLEPGKKADFIAVVAPKWAEGEEERKFYDRLVSETEPQHVRHVAVGGNILKST